MLGGGVLLKAVLMRDSHYTPAISVELVDAIVFDLQRRAPPSGSRSRRFLPPLLDSAVRIAL